MVILRFALNDPTGPLALLRHYPDGPEKETKHADVSAIKVAIPVVPARHGRFGAA
jgi:hypothetical protein